VDKPEQSCLLSDRKPNSLQGIGLGFGRGDLIHSIAEVERLPDVIGVLTSATPPSRFLNPAETTASRYLVDVSILLR
jgi:hypothetical protein